MPDNPQSTPPYLADLATIDSSVLADVLHLSPATIRTKLCRTPWALPPPVRIGRHTVWLVATVRTWLNDRQQHVMPPAEVAATRRRGAPTKAARIAASAGKTPPKAAK